MLLLLLLLLKQYAVICNSVTLEDSCTTLVAALRSQSLVASSASND
jgi:hypothetical protein